MCVKVFGLNCFDFFFRLVEKNFVVGRLGILKREMVGKFIF